MISGRLTAIISAIYKGQKMTKKQHYLQTLRTYDSDWILASARNPSPYMTRTHVLLHLLILKERGFYAI